MRNIVRWGIVIGAVASAVAWIGQSLSSSKGVSLFPDLLSFIAFVLIATAGLQRVLRGAVSRTVAAERATALGATAGVIISVSGIARGLLLWNSPNFLFIAVAMWSSFAAIVVLTIILAVTMWKVPRVEAHT